MSQLRQLGLTPGWIYETVVCTTVEGLPHASPAGVWTHDLRALSMDLYDTSRTLAAVLAAGEYVVDLPVDAGAFFRALHHPSALRFERASVVSAPCLADATATIELRVAEATPHDGRTLVTGSRAARDDSRGRASHQSRRRTADRESHRGHPVRPASA